MLKYIMLKVDIPFETISGGIIKPPVVTLLIIAKGGNPMKMYFKEEEKVTIVHYQQGNKEVSRQSIADYCTEDAVEEICEIAEAPYIAVEHKDIVAKVTELAMILCYLPFIERITLLPKETTLKIEVENKSVKIKVSKELYDFLKELN